MKQPDETKKPEAPETGALSGEALSAVSGGVSPSEAASGVEAFSPDGREQKPEGGSYYPHLKI